MPEPSLDVSWGPHLPWPGARPGARDLPKEQVWVLRAQGPGGGGIAVRGGWVVCGPRQLASPGSRTRDSHNGEDALRIRVTPPLPC